MAEKVQVSKRADAMTASELAQVEATMQHPDVVVREQDGKLVYSCKGVDLLERVPGSIAYTMLTNVPKYQLKKGDVQHLGEATDEQCACSARDYAKAVA